MLGSLTLYRRLLLENVFTPKQSSQSLETPTHKLPTLGHGLAGIMAGWTVSFIAAPVEHVKARLQIQYAADKSKRLYSGPIDCTKKLVCVRSSPNVSQAHGSCNSSDSMASQVFIMVSPQRSFFEHSFSSGGALTTFLHAFSPRIPHYLLPRSTSGRAGYLRRSSGLLVTLPMLSNSAS